MTTSLARRVPLPRLPPLVRFCLVGLSGAVVDLVAFAGLLDLGCSRPAAATGAFLLAVASNLQLNRRWTFGRRGAAWRFLLVSCAGLGVSLLALDALGGAGVPALPAQAAGIAVATPLTYAANRRWTFGDPLMRRSRRGATVRP